MVSFTDGSAGNPTSWAWDFGDGGSSTTQNPSHSYTMADTYTVSLTATNLYGLDTETKTDYVTVYPPGGCGTLFPVDAEAQPGLTEAVPVVLDLGGLAADRFAFSVEVTPIGSAPPLMDDLGFEEAPGLPVPVVTPGNPMSVTWLTPLDEPVTGVIPLGDVLVQVPSTAVPGVDSYSVCLLAAEASLGQDEVCVNLGKCAALTLSVCPEALVGDAYPVLGDLNSDGDTCDYGEFGDDDLTWGDVIAVFDAWKMPGSFPCESGSDRFCAMDCYPQDTDQVVGGDQQITWDDVITTFDRWADPSLPRPRRSLCDCGG